MADRENLVYQAKLAEQAERYDGKAPNKVRAIADCLAPLPPLSLPAQGAWETQVEQLTWICWVRHKMAELSLAK